MLCIVALPNISVSTMLLEFGIFTDFRKRYFQSVLLTSLNLSYRYPIFNVPKASIFNSSNTFNPLINTHVFESAS